MISFKEKVKGWYGFMNTQLEKEENKGMEKKQLVLTNYLMVKKPLLVEVELTVLINYNFLHRN